MPKITGVIMSQHYDVAAVRKSFPAAEHVVYLDSGFQTPLSLPVKEAYDRFLREGLETAGPKQIWLNRLEETASRSLLFLASDRMKSPSPRTLLKA